jgi:predicted dehydrogenase
MAQKVHIPNLMLLEEECELVAIAEVRQDLGKKVQKRWGIPTLYRDHHELAADSSIQAALVSGHYANQGEIAIDLLNSGKDVFMEKPMAITMEQGQRILDAERQSGKRLMLGYMKRFDAGNLLGKKILDGYKETGEMGNVRYIRNSGIVSEWIAGLDTPNETSDEPMPQTVVPWPSWLPEANRGGYISYLQQYTHNVNLVRWLMDAGDDVKVIHAKLDQKDGTSGVVILEVAGATTIIESGFVHGHEWNEHTQIFLEGGWIRLDSPALLLRSVPAGVEVYQGNKPDKEKRILFPEEGRSWPYKEELRHFIDAVKNNTPFRAPAEDALIDVRVLEDIYKKHLESINGSSN